jgi:hypothetical protein
MNSTTRLSSSCKRPAAGLSLARRSKANNGSEKHVLKLCVLYHDEHLRQWAQDVHTLARKLVGRNALKTTWWNVQTLSEPAVLAGAVSTAMHADVIVLAIRAEAELPLAFYYWADAWLPHRYAEPGALLALLAVSEPPRAKVERTREYFRTLAHRGGLDFMCDERPLPVANTIVLRPDARMRDAVSGAVLRTLAYKDRRYRCWQRLTPVAA